jgi:hypothetical protein
VNISGSPARTVVVLVSACLLMGACSRGDDDLADPPRTASTPVPVTPTGVATTDPGPAATETTGIATSPDGSVGAAPSTQAVATTIVVTLPPASTVPEVAEVGVPGLDSDDAFCASWSRFAGSFQVVAVTAAFGSGTAAQLASLEIAASPTVTDAYAELVDNWPDELSSEADLVAEEFLGPFARRLEAAETALSGAGADEATIDTISDAWLAGLAQRDPTTPEFVVDLPDEVWNVIDVAAADFASQRVPFSSDPSLVTNVVTPLTSEYLATSCPDQGTLSGQEIDSP